MTCQVVTIGTLNSDGVVVATAIPRLTSSIGKCQDVARTRRTVLPVLAHNAIARVIAAPYPFVVGAAPSVITGRRRDAWDPREERPNTGRILRTGCIRRLNAGQSVAWSNELTPFDRRHDKRKSQPQRNEHYRARSNALENQRPLFVFRAR